jgi:hypothetical protein
MLISFKDFEVTPRYDGESWGSAIIYENADPTHTPLAWVPIDEIALDIADPRFPEPLDLTTENATLPVGTGWYKIRFVDAHDAGIFEETDPIQNLGPLEILASIDDINGELDGDVVKADANNTNLVQINVSRMVKGYLAKVVAGATIVTWVSPITTPDIVRVIAAKLIAAQVYFNYAARTSVIIEDNNFAQRKYTEAMNILNGIIAGDIPIVGEGGGTTIPPTILGPDEFFPSDATDRAFSLSMRLDG